MQPSNRHSVESRRTRIHTAREEFREIQKFSQSKANMEPVGEHDPQLFGKLVPGAEFISACEIRVVPKVQPKGGAQMKAAIMQSRVFIPGCRFRIDGLAMVKSSGKDAQGNPTRGKQWYRVSVIGTSGGVLFRGFILQTAIRGAIATDKAA